MYFCAMKKDLHPDNYRLVVFKDMSNGYTFTTKSTASTRETIKMEDGNEYPLIKLEISNTSHSEKRPSFIGELEIKLEGDSKILLITTLQSGQEMEPRISWYEMKRENYDYSHGMEKSSRI